MKPHSQGRVELLYKAFLEAKRATGMTNQSFVAEVVAASTELGIDALLLQEGVSWSENPDIDKRRRQDTKNFMRWIGHNEPEEAAQPHHIYTIEAAVLAVFPEQIRLSYLREAYAGVSVCFSPILSSHSLVSCFSVLAKEQCEAQIALAQAVESRDPAAIGRAIREIEDAVQVGSQAMEALKQITREEA